MIYLNNNHMIFPYLSIAIPDGLYIDTNPPACAENGLELISKQPQFRLSLSVYDENISQALRNIGEEILFSKYENININGISGLFLKYSSCQKNCGEILLNINQNYCFSFYISTEGNIDDIFEKDNIKKLIKSIELVNN